MLIFGVLLGVFAGIDTEGLAEILDEVALVVEAAALGHVGHGTLRIVVEHLPGHVEAHAEDVFLRRDARDGCELGTQLEGAEVHLRGHVLHVALVLRHQFYHRLAHGVDEVGRGCCKWGGCRLFLLVLRCIGETELASQLFAQLQQFFHSHAQLLGIERLVQIGVGTGLDALYAVFLGGLCCDHYDGYVAGHLVGPYGAAQLQSVGARHHQVGDDEVGHQLTRLLYALGTVGGNGHLVVVVQLAPDECRHVGVVLDDEQPGCIA